MKISRPQSGFTLIETLVAVAILMVAIAGPLSIAEKALVSAVGSRDQTIASYLAQDLLEYAKSVRDNNILAGRSWLGVLLPLCTAGPCIAETATDIPSSPTSIRTEPACTFSGSPVNLDTSCRLYINATNKYYTYQPGPGNINQPTQFYRAMNITSLGSGDSALVTVSVYWTNGTILNKVILQSIIFNASR